MKYLDIVALEELNTPLASMETGESRISGRVEAYSCKPTHDDRKLKKTLESRYPEESPEPVGKDSVSSPEPTSASLSNLVSPFGPLTGNSAGRKTFFYLLSTLNAAFPDYEFSEVKPDAFSKLPEANLAKARMMTCIEIPNFAQQIWQAIDDTVQISESDVYEFRPEDEGSDPYGEEPTFWTFHFFFFNRKMKRVVFFTCRAISPIARNPEVSEPDLEMDSQRDDQSIQSTPPDSPPNDVSPFRIMEGKRRNRDKSVSSTPKKTEDDESRPTKIGRWTAA